MPLMPLMPLDADAALNATGVTDATGTTLEHADADADADADAGCEQQTACTSSSSTSALTHVWCDIDATWHKDDGGDTDIARISCLYQIHEQTHITAMLAELSVALEGPRPLHTANTANTDAYADTPYPTDLTDPTDDPTEPTEPTDPMNATLPPGARNWGRWGRWGRRDMVQTLKRVIKLMNGSGFCGSEEVSDDGWAKAQCLSIFEEGLCEHTLCKIKKASNDIMCSRNIPLRIH